MRQVAESAATLARRGGSVPVSAIVDHLVPRAEAEVFHETEGMSYRLSENRAYVERRHHGDPVWHSWIPVTLIEYLVAALPALGITDEVVEAAARERWG